MLLLNTRNQVMGQTGDLHRQRQLVGGAPRRGAPNCHRRLRSQHHHRPQPSQPSDPTPSPEDVSITRDLVAGGKLLGIDLLDHVVIGGDRWVSLKERKLMD